MKAVSIDREKCTVCGACMMASPMCFAKQKGKRAIEVVTDEVTCVLCGHCVAACSTEAITHNLMNMKNFPAIDKDKAVKTEDFVRLMRERRSHRLFQNKKIPKKDLEKIVDSMRYAPTGHNDQTVELIIVEDPVRRKKLSNFAVDFFADLNAKQAKELADIKSSGTADPAKIAALEGSVGFMSMIVQGREVGLDPLLYEAPAVVIFHSNAGTTVTPKDNCVIAATMTGLLAKTMGIETTFIALFEHAANGHRPLADELNLPTGNKVYSVLVMGYPKVKYLRAVDRKPIKVRWE
jgi:nitroreductase/NAD-dependent dihydropyrimidine dehydrogenase PreA subunit